MLNNKGFTLIETLFVFFILCLLMTLTMSVHIPVKTADMEIREIKSFLQEAQLYAMTSKKTVKVSFDQKQINYSSTDKVKTFFLSESSSFEKYEMSLNGYGHIKTAKKIYYHTSEKDYAFVYQVGSGYFYVE